MRFMKFDFSELDLCAYCTHGQECVTLVFPVVSVPGLIRVIVLVVLESEL